MTDYIAPLEDMAFVLNELADFSQLSQIPGFEDATEDMVAAILEEAGKQAHSIISPLNKTGDLAGVQLTATHDVVTPEGFKEAYQQYIESGWSSLQFEPEYGGQGLPFSLAIPVQEMWHAANMAWGLCPLLSQGAIEAIASNASTELKERFLPRMIEGAWTGTMNLTEPQSGSDLATIRTKATPQGDHYLIKGQKIFITWGEHDMAENIIHLVLARLPDAPAGSKGISLFLVPKYLVNADGSLGDKNDCKAVSLEHKIGIHASPTCAMSYGDEEGAIGYLIGEKHKGLACMFTMMNNARLTVGLQGVAIAERAYQSALEYAGERVQGIPFGGDETTPIIGHPDVQRMLMTIKSLTEAGRAMAYQACTGVDFTEKLSDDIARLKMKRRVGVLTPMVKGWCTEMAQEATSLAVQVHGGMGFIEETGVGQYFRDARILPIYEGTNGIQSLDLIGRKTLFDKGVAMYELIEEMENFIETMQMKEEIGNELLSIFSEGVKELRQSVEFILVNGRNQALIGSISSNYLMLASYVVAGWQMMRTAEISLKHLANETDREEFYRNKVENSRFFIGQILPRSGAYFKAIKASSLCANTLKAS